MVSLREAARAVSVRVQTSTAATVRSNRRRQAVECRVSQVSSAVQGIRMRSIAVNLIQEQSGPWTVPYSHQSTRTRLDPRPPMAVDPLAHNREGNEQRDGRRMLCDSIRRRGHHRAWDYSTNANGLGNDLHSGSRSYKCERSF